MNGYFAWRRRERALLNDLASVAQSCLMVLVAATVAGAGISRGVPAFAAILLYFTGTVLYVKTMIRERGNASYHRIGDLPRPRTRGGSLAHIPIAAVFVLLLIRAAMLPRHRLTPKHVGITEIVAATLVLITAMAA